MLEKIKNNYFLLVSTFLILYFLFNLLSGQRGLVSYFDKKQTLNNLKKEELLLIKKINDLDYKNQFLFGKKNEKIYILKNNDKKN